MKSLSLFFLSLIISFCSFAQSTVDFDGVNDYISLGANSGDNVRTVEFWFKLDNAITPNLNSFVMLCSREFSSANINEWHISFTPSGTRINSASGKLRFAVVSSIGSAREVLSDTNNWNANQWYHVAGVIDPVQGMMLFIDGKKQSNTDPGFTSATASMSQPLEIGRHNGFSSRYFQGEMDDFHLASTALYSTNFNPPCPDRLPVNGTIGLWNFNTNTGFIAYDSGPAQNDVSLIGASWGNSNVCLNGRASLAFDGVDDYISLGANSGNNVRTVEFWFKLDNAVTPNLSSFVMLCNREVSSSNTNEWHISLTPTGTRLTSASGKLRFAVTSSTGNTREVLSNANNWNANQWYHVAGVIDPVQGMMLFIDGIKQSSTDPNLTSATPSMSQPLEIGRHNGFSSRYFDGNIEDFHLASTALYTINFTPPCPDRLTESSTIGLWNLNKKGGAIAYDAGPLNNDVPINGASWDSSFTCQTSPVGLEQLISDNEDDEVNFTVYPNPTQDVIYFSGLNDLSRVTIFSLEGKLIREINLIGRNQIELPNKAGFYLLRFERTSGGFIQRSVIRQ